MYKRRERNGGKEERERRHHRMYTGKERKMREGWM